jgi:hypothetical protein
MFRVIISPMAGTKYQYLIPEELFVVTRSLQLGLKEMSLYNLRMLRRTDINFALDIVLWEFVGPSNIFTSVQLAVLVVTEQIVP